MMDWFCHSNAICIHVRTITLIVSPLSHSLLPICLSIHIRHGLPVLLPSASLDLYHPPHLSLFRFTPTEPLLSLYLSLSVIILLSSNCSTPGHLCGLRLLKLLFDVLVMDTIMTPYNNVAVCTDYRWNHL